MLEVNFRMDLRHWETEDAMSLVYHAQMNEKYRRSTKGSRIRLKIIIGQTNQTEGDARSKVEQSGK